MSDLKKKVSMILSIILISALFGCSVNRSNGDDTKTTEDGEKIIELSFAWWGSQVRHDRTQQVIDLFEKQNPNIKINAEFSGWDGYWEKLATRAAGRNLPDLIQMSYAYLAEYVDRGLLADLTPYVENGILNFDDVDSLYLDSGKLDNKLYAVNLGANAFTIIYDPAVFESVGIPELKPGYTYEDLANTARKLKEKLGKGKFGVKTFDHIDAFKHYLRQNGKWLYNDENNALGYEDDQLMADFYQYWVDLIDEGTATTPDVDSAVQGLEDELIVHGKAPILATNSNQLIGLVEAAEHPLKAMIYPTLPGGMEGHFITPSQYISLTSHSKHPEEASKFIDFLTNNLEANEILQAERGVPISSKVREHLLPSLDDATKETFEYLELVQEHSRPVNIIAPPGEGEIRTLFERTSQAVNYGEMTPMEAAKSSREEATAILEKQAK